MRVRTWYVEEWSEGWRGLSACAADTSMRLAFSARPSAAELPRCRLVDLLCALATAASALFAALAVTAWAAAEASAL
jgi:hypothetical protein